VVGLEWCPCCRLQPSDTKLVFFSSTIIMMHGPINITLTTNCSVLEKGGNMFGDGNYYDLYLILKNN